MSMPGIAADRDCPVEARPTSVLIVEDDAGIATQLARALQDVASILAELRARIRAGLRRRRPHHGEVLRCGDLAVDVRACTVTLAGREMALTRPKEFGILECRASDPGRVVTRQDILDQAWDAHWYGPMKALGEHSAALRKKLGEPKVIETVYGRGFRLTDPH